MAPAAAIMRWHDGFSARLVSAPVAAPCTPSCACARRPTSGSTAPAWQISSEWKLSRSVVGSSSAAQKPATRGRGARAVCVRARQARTERVESRGYEEGALVGRLVAEEAHKLGQALARDHGGAKHPRLFGAVLTSRDAELP